MKSYFLFFFILILFSTSLIQAVGFSPTSLTFELEQNQEECKMITITSDSETITILDSWAENKDIEWKVGLFDTDASLHGISLDYPSEILLDERNVEVCLSGSNLGEYHGVLILKEEQQGNSIIQFGVWLKVLINEQQEVSPQELSSEENSGSSNNAPSSGGSADIKNSTTTTNESEKEIVESNSGTNEENIGSENSDSKITGGVIETSRVNENPVLLGLILLFFVAFIVYSKRRNA